MLSRLLRVFKAQRQRLLQNVQLDSAVSLGLDAVDDSEEMNHLTTDERLKEADDHLKNGRLDLAEIIYQDVLKLQQAPAGAHVNLGLIYARRANYTLAIECFGKAIAVNPEYVEAYVNLGVASRMVDDLDSAKAAFQAALQYKSDYSEAYNGLGTIAELSGQDDKAIGFYSSAIRCNPQYADAHFNLGNVYQKQNCLNDAVDAYSKALQVKKMSQMYIII